jgi:riboflavin kinase/FMN adenylyltransferase
MQHSHSLDDLHLENVWLTIGIFDGVHRGHQQVLNRLVAGAHAAGCLAVVLTFDPHPAIVLGGKAEFRSLTTPGERVELLEALGVDVVITQPFDRRFAEQGAEEFMRRLSRSLGLRHLVLGHDSALGRGREGDAPRLAEIGQTLNYTVEVVPPLADAAGIISSTRIRKALEAGDVASAAADLGRPYFVRGPVVHGDGRGRHINVPTANLQVPPGKLIPGDGIYATWAWADGGRHAAATSIGLRPTFESASPGRTLEAYLLDFDRDLYGQELKLEFVAWLRAEMKFPSAEALIVQIHADVARTRQTLS